MRRIGLAVGLAASLSVAASVPVRDVCAAAPVVAPATNSLGMRFVRLPAGEFSMGSSAEDEAADDDERPRHRVRITQSFALAQFETTQREFRAVMGSNPSWFCATGGGAAEVAGVDTDTLPVDMTTWDEAVAFCHRLSDLPAERAAGRTYRLPTEAEWEYACRAGTATRFSIGDELLPTQACIAVPLNGDSPSADGSKAAVRLRPQPVGSYPANRFGLHDMHGNAWEWCEDRYDSEAYRTTVERLSAGVVHVAVDPQGPEVGTGRVVRGGDYRFPASMARSANRDLTRQSRRDQGNGFRVVMETGERE